MVRDGQMLLDFVANATGITFLQSPSTAAPNATKNFPNLDPTPSGKPELNALKAFIARNFTFPVPKSCLESSFPERFHGVTTGS